jgi:hypothetical protein
LGRPGHGSHGKEEQAEPGKYSALHDERHQIVVQLLVSTVDGSEVLGPDVLEVFAALDDHFDS